MWRIHLQPARSRVGRMAPGEEVRGSGGGSGRPRTAALRLRATRIPRCAELDSAARKRDGTRRSRILRNPANGVMLHGGVGNRILVGRTRCAGRETDLVEPRYCPRVRRHALSLLVLTALAACHGRDEGQARADARQLVEPKVGNGAVPLDSSRPTAAAESGHVVAPPALRPGRQFAWQIEQRGVLVPSHDHVVNLRREPFTLERTRSRIARRSIRPVCERGTSATTLDATKAGRPTSLARVSGGKPHRLIGFRP